MFQLRHVPLLPLVRIVCSSACSCSSMYPTGAPTDGVLRRVALPNRLMLPAACPYAVGCRSIFYGSNPPYPQVGCPFERGASNAHTGSALLHSEGGHDALQHCQVLAKHAPHDQLEVLLCESQLLPEHAAREPTERDCLWAREEGHECPEERLQRDRAPRRDAVPAQVAHHRLAACKACRQRQQSARERPSKFLAGRRKE